MWAVLCAEAELCCVEVDSRCWAFLSFQLIIIILLDSYVMMQQSFLVPLNTLPRLDFKYILEVRKYRVVSEPNLYTYLMFSIQYVMLNQIEMVVFCVNFYRSKKN